MRVLSCVLSDLVFCGVDCLMVCVVACDELTPFVVVVVAASAGVDAHAGDGES